MANCLGCGSEMSGANFCGRCGMPARSAGSGDGEGGDTSISPQGILLQGGDDSVGEQGALTTDTPKLFWAGIAAVTVGALMWAMMQAPAVDEALNDEVAALEDEAFDEGSVALDPVVKERLDEEGLAPAIDSRLDLGADAPAEESASTAGEAKNTVPGDDAGDPVSAPPVGYRILVDGEGLIDIDLDNGAVVRRNGEVDLVGVSGTELIIYDATQGFAALPIADLDADRRELFSVPETIAGTTPVSAASLRSASVRSPDTLLIEFDRGTGNDAGVEGMGDGVQLFEVEIGSGRFRASAIEGVGGLSRFGATHHGLASVPGGGLFEASGNSYRKLSDGRPLLLGINYAIVQDCVQPGECSEFWIDRATGQRVVRPLPQRQRIDRLSEVDEMARLLRVDGLDADGESETSYFDVEGDRWLSAMPALSVHPELAALGGTAEALSRDGRWFAVPTGYGLLLYDVTSDVQYRMNLRQNLLDSRLLFVSNGREPIG